MYLAMVKSAETDDDAEKMARFVSTRDRRMFDVLVTKHRRSMVAYAGRYVRNPASLDKIPIPRTR